MASTRTNSFIKEFKARLTGNDAEAKSQRAWRSAESSMKVRIAVIEKDIVKAEEEVERLNDSLADARVNNGQVISNTEMYAENLIEAKNNLTQAERSVNDLKKELQFFKEEYKKLRSE